MRAAVGGAVCIFALLLGSAHPDNVFIIKMNYWLGL